MTWSLLWLGLSLVPAVADAAVPGTTTEPFDAQGLQGTRGISLERSPAQSSDESVAVPLPQKECGLGRSESVCESTALEVGDVERADLSLGPASSPSLRRSGSAVLEHSEQSSEEGAVPLPGAEGRAAPMCDPTAASVVAGPFVPDAQGGTVEELPCEQWRLLLQLLGAQASDAEAAVVEGGTDSPDSAKSSTEDLRAFLWGVVVQALQRSGPKLLATGVTRSAPAREFRMAVYRPPAIG